MKHLSPVLLSLALTVLPACGGGTDFTGSWTLDNDAALEALMAEVAKEMEKEAEGADPAAEAIEGLEDMAMEMAKSMIKNMDVQLNVDEGGKFDMSMKVELMGQTSEESQSGTWTASGNSLTLDPEEEGEENLVATLDDDGMLRAKMPGDDMDVTLVFMRKP